MNFQGMSSSNFAQAGKAAADDTVRAHAAARRNAPKYGRMVQAMDNFRAGSKQAAIAAQAQVTKTGIDAAGKLEAHNIKLDAQENLRGAKRKAGVLAAGGQLLAKGSDAFKEAPKYETDSIDYSGQITKLRDKASSYYDQVGKGGNSSKTSTSATTPDKTVDSSSSTLSASGTALGGARKELADAIAGPESGSWGYEAFNQGGAAGGTKVLGKSGSHKETFGKSLSDMTLGEIFHKQNTAQRGMSLDEHYKSGGLHAVGRYQFIGSTLQDEVAKMGLSHDTKFTPQVQDDIFFSHIKRVGNISPWVGPSVNYGQDKKNHLNSLIGQI